MVLKATLVSVWSLPDVEKPAVRQRWSKKAGAITALGDRSMGGRTAVCKLAVAAADQVCGLSLEKTQACCFDHQALSTHQREAA